MTHKPQRATQIGALFAVVAAAAAMTEPPPAVVAASPEPSRASGDETAPGAHLYYAPKEQQ